MTETFEFTLLSPSKQVVHAQVSEVVIPAHNGEVGVLPRHEDFLGLLGSGALKMVHEGDDYWFLVSAGVFQVRNGALTVIAEIVQEAKEIDVDRARARLTEVSSELLSANLFDPQSKRLVIEAERLKGQLEVHRRTDVVN